MTCGAFSTASLSRRGRWDLWGGAGGGAGAVTSLAFGADGQTLVSGSADGTVGLWDLRAGELKAALGGHREGVLAVALGPDGSTIASAAADGAVRLWDIREENRVRPQGLGPARQASWHRALAEQAERDQAWFAAAFHPRQLVEGDPGDARLKRRLAEAREKLKPPRPMEPLPP